MGNWRDTDAVLVAHLFVLLSLLMPRAMLAQQTYSSDADTATWGNILWIVLVIVAAAAFIALATIGLRSSTKE